MLLNGRSFQGTPLKNLLNNEKKSFRLYGTVLHKKEKTDDIVQKENEKLSEFIGKSLSELKMELGKPDEDFKNAKGNLEVIYNTKKYLIPCERRFEINSDNIVIGFVSNGCF